MLQSNGSENHSSQDVNEIARAVTSIAAQGWMQAKEVDKTKMTVSPNELTSLSALISYVAFHSGENEFRVERKLADRFNIPNVSCLPATQYDNAIRYLVDAMVAI